MKTQEHHYRRVVNGQFDQRWQKRFDGPRIHLHLRSGKTPETVLNVTLNNSAALYGSISRLRDLSLALIYLNRIEVNDKGKIWKR